MNQSIVFAVSGTPSVTRRYDSCVMPMSVTGYTSNWNTSGGRSPSRAISAITAARLPPAESPPTATRLRSMPSASDCAITQPVAAAQSSTAAGNLYSGAMR